MNKKILILLAIIMLVPLLSFSQKNNENFIQIKGSDTLVNCAQMLAEDFMQSQPEIFVAITGGGSGVGIASLLNKTCDIATASRDISAKEIEMAAKNGVTAQEHKIAYDGIAVIINNSNPVKKLTIDQLNKIYTGKITNWQELGGKNLKIILLSREVNSGTHVYFKEEVIRLGKKDSQEEFASSVLLLPSSQAIIEETRQNEAAIGYLGMGYICPQITVLEISNDNKNYYSPNIKNVIEKKYPLSRALFMYTNGEPKNKIKTFLNYVFSTQGQTIVKKSGFVPLTLNTTDVKEN
jgi:phosphate transport system substrate-binding protein